MIKNGTKIPWYLYIWIAKWKTKDSASSKGQICARKRPWPSFVILPLKHQAQPSVGTVCVAALTRTYNHPSVRQYIRCSELVVWRGRGWQLSSAACSHSLLHASLSGSAGYWPQRQRGDKNSGRVERRQLLNTDSKKLNPSPCSVKHDAMRVCRCEGRAPHFLCAIQGYS
jgi:hypothetical protein